MFRSSHALKRILKERRVSQATRLDNHGERSWRVAETVTARQVVEGTHLNLTDIESGKDLPARLATCNDELADAEFVENLRSLPQQTIRSSRCSILAECLLSAFDP